MRATNPMALDAGTKLGLVLASCLLVSSGRVNAQEVEITPHVVYGNKAGLALTLNVYQPADQNGAAIIFLWSGGGRSSWAWDQFREEPNGSLRLATDDELRTVMAPLPMFSFVPLLAEGFTVFEAHHGSAPQFKMPEHLADLRQAVRFIRLHALEYGVDPERLGVWGGSGGGILGLLLGATADEGDADAPTSLGRMSSRVAAVVAYFPPSDLERHIAARPPEQLPLYHALVDKEDYHALSPLHHASSDDAPTLIVTGDADEKVSAVEGRSMSEALGAHGVETQFVLIPGAGHGFLGDAAEQARQAMLEWFRRHLETR